MFIGNISLYAENLASSMVDRWGGWYKKRGNKDIDNDIGHMFEKGSRCTFSTT
jgi:hypothetical protein